MHTKSMVCCRWAPLGANRAYTCLLRCCTLGVTQTFTAHIFSSIPQLIIILKSSMLLTTITRAIKAAVLFTVRCVFPEIN